MARGPTILVALLAAAVALLLWVGTERGADEAPGERSVLGPSATLASEALTPVPSAPAPADLVRAPRDNPSQEQRTAATPVAPPRAEAELTLDVVDASTGRPVAAFFATVLPAGQHAQGRDGVARFTGLSAGTFTLQVQGPEHEATLAMAELPAAGPVQVRLTQRPGLRGIVRFADARPAPDVVLRLELSGAAPPSAPAASATAEVASTTQAKSDADGRYRFAPLAPGLYTVVGEHLGRTLTPLGPVEVTTGMTDLPELRLEAGARLEIEVTDTGGAPAGNILIVVVPGTGTALRRYSASDGKLILEPLVPGPYVVTLPVQGIQAEQRRELKLSVGLHRETFQVNTGQVETGTASHR